MSTERADALAADGPWTIELGRKSVVINGQDLSSHCRSISVHHRAQAGKTRPDVFLELVLNYGDRLSFVDGADVGVDRRTERLLRDLGWTAPDETATCGADSEEDKPCVRVMGHPGPHLTEHGLRWPVEG